MGLDLVETVTRTEEVFGITIPNDEAETIRSVGDLYGIVCVHLKLPSTTTAPRRGMASAMP